MITEQEKKLIKQVIGTRALSAIHTYFINNNITKDNGQPYSKSHISNVLNGGISHDIIEEGIAKAATHYQELARKKAQAKQELIQKLQEVQGKDVG